MKRKSTSKSETQSLFANQVFVISKTTTNKKHLAAKIISLGGKVVDRITKNVTYFVQDYNVDDDGRLASVKKHHGKVVSPVFIDRCESEGRVLGFHEYAIGLPTYEESKFKRTKTKQKANKESTDRSPPDNTNNNQSTTKEYNEDRITNNDKNTKDTTDNHQQAFKIPADTYNELFSAIREGDREEEEFPQTFDNFLEMPDKNIITNTKKYIYILPLGYDPKEYKTSKGEKGGQDKYRGIALDMVEEFLQAFFGVQTKILSFWEIKQTTRKTELLAINKSFSISTDKQNRLQVMDLLEVMWDYIPKDACCVVGLTLHDIFESEWDENQFWGRATGDGCAVISLHRFNPALFDGEEKKDEKLILSLNRSLNTIVHEAMHVFGIDHCVFYKCNMNSSEPILTNIDGTLHLCPIDLRKLQHTFKFDVIQRYQNLLTFYKKHQFDYESDWVTKRLRFLIE